MALATHRQCILYQQLPKTRLQCVRYTGKKRSPRPQGDYPALFLPGAMQTDWLLAVRIDEDIEKLKCLEEGS